MPPQAQTDKGRERVRNLHAEQDYLLELPERKFDAFCWDIATMRRDPVHGLLGRLRAKSTAGELFRVDPRITMLRRAEEAVVDQLEREQLIGRLRDARLTSHMCDYWLRRRPREVPRINGIPIWLAVRSVDVVG